MILPQISQALSDSSISQLVLVAVVVFVTLRWMVSAAQSYRSDLSQFPGPWYAPFTGLHLTYGFATGTVWKQVERQHKRYGPWMRLGPRQIWVADKMAIKEILSTVDLPKVVMYAEISREKESAGLFGEVRPPVHKKLKKLLSPAFTVSYVDRIDHLFQKPIEDLLSVYRVRLSEARHSGQQLFQTNFMEDLHKVALEIMGECAFGRGFGSVSPLTQPEPGFDMKSWLRIPDAIFRGTSRRYKLVFFKRALRKFGIHLNFDWPTEMVSAIDSVISRRRDRDDDAVRHDLLQHLIDNGTRPDNDRKMNSRDILDHLSEILLAGAETTSATIACFFLEVSRHPEVKKRLMETLPALSIDDPLIDGMRIRNDPAFAYLNACIKENLRMHPIASEMGRKTTATPIVHNGRVIPPYTVVSASYRALHFNPEYWPEPERFWPERFLPLSSPDRGNAPPVDNDAYYPFSAGRHSCIGINFAWHEMRIVIANLCARFDIQELPQQPVDFRQFITMQFSGSTWHAALTPRV